MKLKVLIPFAQWSKGDVIPDVPGGRARDLIQRNLCVEDTEKAIRAPIDRMMRRKVTK